MVVIGEEELLVIPMNLVVLLVGGMPFSALFACVVLSILLHWEDATHTHCNVPNYLPSVSAAVASYAPERYVWRILIIAHVLPRVALTFAFRSFLITSPLRPFSGVIWFPWLCNLACVFNIAELFFLAGLAAVSSMEDYYLHKISFIGFIFCGITYMFVATWLFDYSGRRRTTSMGEQSFQYKVLCCTGFVCSLLLALYFYYRHNSYCEPGVYSMFAMCEYAIVIFNILFHCTLYYDFHARSFSLVSSSSAYHYDALPLHNSYEEKRT